MNLDDEAQAQLAAYRAAGIARNAELAAARKVVDAAWNVVVAARLDNVWLKDVWIAALRAELVAYDAIKGDGGVALRDAEKVLGTGESGMQNGLARNDDTEESQ